MMNDKNISNNPLSSRGFHRVRRSMALQMISFYSDMPTEIRKNLGYDSSKKSTEKYVYAKVSREQMKAALATLLDLEVPSK